MNVRDALRLPPDRSRSSELHTTANPKAGVTPGLVAEQARAVKALVSSHSVEGLSKAPQQPALKALIGRQVESLHSQLAGVHVAIHELMQQIQAKRAEEDSIKDSIGSGADAEQTIMRNLQKAADALDEIRRQTSLLS